MGTPTRSPSRIINGEVFAMTGGTLAHNDITLNLYRTLYPQVRASALNHEATRRSPLTTSLQGFNLAASSVHQAT